MNTEADRESTFTDQNPTNPMMTNSSPPQSGESNDILDGRPVSCDVGALLFSKHIWGKETLFFSVL